MELNSTFGDYIRSERKARGITNHELAEQLDLNIITISKIERGWKQFPKEKLKLLSEIYKSSFQEIIKIFIKTDLIQQYGIFPNYEKILREVIANVEKTSIKDIISKGETKNIEFKSTLRYCLKKRKVEKYIEHSAIKNICAFLNSNGGKLIIGVADDGEILGLENTDFKTFNEENKRDAFLKHFDNLISKYFGNDLSLNIGIKFEQINSDIVCEIEVIPNNRPVFLKNTQKDNKEEFYIRRNASSIALNMDEFYKYSKERW